MNFPKLYECDPQKNTECNKRNCGNPCKYTTRKEFSREPSEKMTTELAFIEDAVATAFARLAGRFTRRGVSECRKSASIIARST